MRSIGLALSLVLIFMVPWEGMVRVAGIGNAAKVMGVVVAAFWIVTVVITGRLRKPGLFHIMVCLFVLWNAVSIFWSADPYRTLGHLMTWAQLLVFVILIWDLYTTRTALLAGLQAYILGAYVAFGSAIANYFSGTVFYTHYHRFSSGETNPDGFGFIMALGIPVAWYLAGTMSSAIKMGHLLKLLNYTYIPAALFGIALSGTRTALIAAIPGMVFGVGSLTRLRPAGRITVFVLLTSGILMLLPIVQPLKSFERFSTTVTEVTEGNLNQRLLLWREGFEAFIEQPLTGVGSNTYRSVNSLGKVAHNSYLSILVEVGLIGFVLFGIILAIAIIEARDQRGWDSRFWLTILLVWAIGASTLTWEHRKTTWLFLSLITVSAALTRRPHDDAVFGRRSKREVQFIPNMKYN